VKTYDFDLYSVPGRLDDVQYIKNAVFVR